MSGYTVLPPASLTNLRCGVVAAGFTRRWTFKVIVTGTVQAQFGLDCAVVGQSDTQEYEDERTRDRKVRVRRVTLRPLAEPKQEIKMGDTAIGPDNLEFIVEGINPSDVSRIECVRKDTIAQAGNDGFVAVGKVMP